MSKAREKFGSRLPDSSLTPKNPKPNIKAKKKEEKLPQLGEEKNKQKANSEEK